jgi:hypothetical protein
LNPSKEAGAIEQSAIDPHIRENVCFVGYDPLRTVGYLIQLSRWCHDPAIWREQVQVFLPDGGYLLHRGWGRDGSRDEPAAALLQVIALEPGRRWRISYRGPARYTTAVELSCGPLRERTQQLLDLDVTFESDYEVWEMHSQSADRKWGHAHAEQPGRIRGRIELDGSRTDIDGHGYRNRSRGTRTLSVLVDHCWAHGIFSGGRAFAISSVRMQGHENSLSSATTHARIWNAGRLYVATCSNPPLLGDLQHALADPPDRLTFELDSDLGPMRVDAQTMASIPHSTTVDGEWLDGVITDASLAYLVAYERPMVLKWNGERGSGHIEQSRRI